MKIKKIILPIIGAAVLSSTFYFFNQPKLYPDHKLTPGEISKDWTIQDVCKNGTGQYRNVSEAVKKEVLKRYGITKELAKGTIEIDHWYPLGIGGSNSIQNLWPMPAPQFHQKDIIENKLNQLVCKQKMNVYDAKKIIDNWYENYKKIKNNLGKKEDYCEQGCP